MANLVLLLSCVIGLQYVNADYRCWCIYDIETSVYSEDSTNSTVIGYLYEFDCKPEYQGETETGFVTIHFENKIGYVPRSDSTEAQQCPGNVTESDQVTTPIVKTTQEMSNASDSTTTLPTTPVSTPASSTTSLSTPAASLSTTTTLATPTTPLSTPTPIVELLDSTITTLTSTPMSVSSTATQSIVSSSLPASATTLTRLTDLTTHVSTQSTSPTKADITHCEDNWVYYQDSCYFFHTQGTRLHWSDANHMCSTLNAHLVALESSEENLFVVDELRRLLNDEHGVWLAGTNQYSNHWQWYLSNTDTFQTMHTMESFIRTRSTRDEHEGSGEHEHEHSSSRHCLYIRTEERYEWRTSECDSHKQFVCEKDAVDQTLVVSTTAPENDDDKTTASTDENNEGGETTSRAPDGDGGDKADSRALTPLIGALVIFEAIKHYIADCPGNWVLHGDSCYMFSQNRTDWMDAYRYCYILHSHLVIINDANESTFITDALQARINVAAIGIDHVTATGAWTAGNDRNLEGLWEWSDPVSHVYGGLDEQEYSNWFTGQPDNGGTGENCLGLIGSFQFQWMDRPCDDDMFFVCELSRPQQQNLFG